MRDESSQQAITAGAASPRKTAPECETERSTIPSQTTVQGSEISLSDSQQRRKHFLIYGKQGLHTLHRDPPRSSEAMKRLIATLMQTGFPVSHTKQTVETHSNCYKFDGSFTNLDEINRKPELLETRVSHSKQITSQKSIANFHRVLISHFPTLFPNFRPLLCAHANGRITFALLDGSVT
jgi:hypothetical protein